MGTATMASTITLNRERVCASHQASGVPTMRSTTTVINASRKVTQRVVRSASPIVMVSLLLVPTRIVDWEDRHVFVCGANALYVSRLSLKLSGRGHAAE